MKKYVNLKGKSGLSWKERLLVYLATILLCILAANFRPEIQHFTGNHQNMNVEISTIEK
ncbi:hypothetical protein [Echinicola vietnamensis]|uniref:Uncharacterized protein n=1 Tax=Echinicola vietnamensis (strain DSM 17526 / LMG 23754 / KMM 6221) TaxID=926556 RepID=L0FYT4_ECHVK|nr:hypothetical protein [Echinicola vietnamensis]AGA77921.1 hypothetical protein Echvi_1656 [Echinicola vietnamensis DSM 17526]